MAFFDRLLDRKIRRLPARCGTKTPYLERLEDRCLLTFSVTDLGALDHNSYAWGLNSNGQVVGESPGLSSGHAFLWQSDTGMQDIGTLTKGGCSSAFGVNENGFVVGSSSVGSCDPSRSEHAALWDGKGIHDLGTLPGGRDSLAEAINNTVGQVVGVSRTAEGLLHGFLFDPRSPDRLFDLGTLPGGRESWANAINDGGQIVGWSDTVTPISRGRHAFLYGNGMMRDLGTLLGGRSSQATAINSLGEVVGVSDAPGSSSYHAVRWNDQGIQDLDTLSGGFGSVALGSDDDGDIVGWYATQALGQRAFLYTGGTMYDLNDLIPKGSGWRLISATAIHGAIVGFGRNSDGQLHGFLVADMGQGASAARTALEVSALTAGGDTLAAPAVLTATISPALPAPAGGVTGSATDDFVSSVLYTTANAKIANQYQGQTASSALDITVFALVEEPSVF